jgi:glycosyltransferase involved in cell wall biosynthesis
LADRIVVCSRYALESFLARGFKPEQMAHHEVKVSRRFVQHPFVQRSGPFRVVYCGTISASKGVPDLLEAFRQLEDRAARLTLVGYTGSRGMRRFLELAMRRDDRVVLAPGDPLPPLLEAHLYVHPSYQDGFARSALEALAARVPVIVTEDTGMKDLVVPGVNGWVVPAGDVPALAEMIRHVRRCQLVPPPLDPAHVAPAAEAAVPGRLPGSSHA